MPGEARDDCLITHDSDQVTEGGPGDDHYRVSSRTDRIIGRHGEGLETVEWLGDFTLSADL